MTEYVGNNGRVTDCTAIVLMGEKIVICLPLLL